VNIKHEPLFDTAKVEELYGRKDGCEIRYVCTSDLNASDVPCDIFYRAEPHPDFGNRYFGLYWDSIRDCMMITNADKIEELEFGMIEVDGNYYYSQSHHDYKVVGDKMIDGGRQYIRSGGGAVAMKVKNGNFIRNYGDDVANWIGNDKEELA
tara:strand:- start:720 stop:1175 length:456 start_codon:yes stop_codon:yes gene_type:complete